MPGRSCAPLTHHSPSGYPTAAWRAQPEPPILKPDLLQAAGFRHPRDARRDHHSTARHPALVLKNRLTDHRVVWADINDVNLGFPYRRSVRKPGCDSIKYKSLPLIINRPRFEPGEKALPEKQTSGDRRDAPRHVFEHPVADLERARSEIVAMERSNHLPFCRFASPENRPQLLTQCAKASSQRLPEY